MSETQVRIAALHAVGSIQRGTVPSWLVACLGDAQPEVRALASSLLLTLPGGPEVQQAHAALLALLEDPEATAVVAGLRRTPLAYSSELLQRCASPSPAVASAALLRLAELEGATDVQRQAWLQAATAALARGETEVRRAALQLVEKHIDLVPAEPAVWANLAAHLQEGSKATRDRAVSLLARCPLDLSPILRPYLEASSWATARAAVQVLSASAWRESRDRLQHFLREQVRQLWILTLVLREELPQGQGAHPLTPAYFRLCLENARDRSRKITFDTLAALETPKVIRSVEKVLRFSNVRARADALEVLSNLGDREAAQLLVLLLEAGETRDKLSALPASLIRQAEWSVFSVSSELNKDQWLAQAARWLQGTEPLQPHQEETLERLVILRKVPLFAQMNLEQLVAIDQRLEEVQYLAGEVVFEEGQLGAELYILLDGAVKIVKARGSEQELLLTRLEAVNYFGEMAILDDEPRSASVVVERNSRLLVLKGEQLKDLVEQMPEMAFEIIKVLTGRIRQADDRLNQMVKSKA